MADEIVVAVDVSGGEQDLAPLGAVADRLFEIELGTFLESAMAWLHAQCSGEWILRIDDDEALDADLLQQLPALTRARDVAQYWLTRRWVYPDIHHWLEEWPWFPDFQGRLVRNDARLWFPGLCHSSVAHTLPARYLEVGMYHLAHLLSSREEREHKVERYLNIDPALRETAADAYLPAYYLPERRPSARIAQVNVSDRAAIDLIAAHAPAPHRYRRTPRSRAQRVPRIEVEACWAERQFDEAAYNATIQPVDIHRRLVAKEHRPFRVSVRNEGNEWWPGGGEDRRPLIRVTYRWLTTEGAIVESEGHRTALPHPLGPGESCLVTMNVTSPAVAGPYVLEPDLVHEHVRWFKCESEPVEILVTAPKGPPR